MHTSFAQNLSFKFESQCIGILSREEEGIGSFSAIKNAGRMTKDGVLGTASTPIDTVTSDTTTFKEQLWRTFCVLAVAFLLISGVGALIENRGIGKGLGLNEEVHPIDHRYGHRCDHYRELAVKREALGCEYGVGIRQNNQQDAVD